VLRNFVLAAGLAVILSAIGCGGSSTTVEGQVSFDGNPIEKGFISFRPVDGKGPSFGGPIVGGRYNVEENVRTGEKRVSITAINESKMARSRAAADQMIADAKARGESIEKATNVDLIPHDAEGNNQVVTVEAGANTINFELTSKTH